ncbi:MAG: putative dual-specificity RNA methyltransferase RlmN [Candidatus Hydrogenedentota bacterium]
MMKPSITDLTPQEMADALELQGFQGRQIFRWIHKKQTFDFEKMSDLSKELRARLPEVFSTNRLEVIHISKSNQARGTKKALFKLHDGETVESVLIPAKDRVTICLSTQVGCAVKCSFCATGHSGYTRNLSAGEIVEQALHLLATEKLGERTPNIVFMGMGEPFRNYENTLKAIHLLKDGHGLKIGARKITVSTAGEVKGIRRFAQDGGQVRLSVSLHAANNKLRDELVPLNRKFPIEMLMDAITEYTKVTGRQITFEWTLLNNVNDSFKDASELITLARQVNAFVNLIPYNPVQELGYEPPSGNRCFKFHEFLEKAGINATLRTERGQDIDAACGQLRRRLAPVG